MADSEIKDEHFLTIRRVLQNAEIPEEEDFGTYAIRESNLGIGTSQESLVWVDFVKLKAEPENVGYFDISRTGLTFRVHRKSDHRSRFNTFSKALQQEGVPWSKI